VEMIDWVAEEVKTVPDIVWQLNNNFTVLTIEGVLSMLNGEGCQELGCFHELTASSDATVLQAGGADSAKVVETAWLA
jgi:hypothetical protein